MGLDMYLLATRSVGSAEYRSQSERDLHERILTAMNLPPSRPCHVDDIEIKLTIGYWRKANAVHGWFVDEVQDGSDDGREHFVPRESLSKLRQLCVDVIAAFKRKDLSWCKENLPPMSGFFFGTTDLDDGYLSDLEETVRIMDYALSLPDDFSFHYHASW